MTDRKITDLPVGMPSAGDWVPYVDISDTVTPPADASGGDKRSTLANLVGAALAPYVDQLPALAAGATGAALLQALRSAIANRDLSRCDIPVIGDSITEGQGATAMANRWTSRATRALRTAYPTLANGSSGGLGFIPVLNSGETTFTWPVTRTAGSASTYIGVGPTRLASSMNSGNTPTFQWTAPAGTTSVKIMYFDSSVAGSFSYKVNSGATTTVTNANTGDGKLTAAVPITGGQVLTIAWVSGNAFVEGIVHYAGDESSGITLHSCGHFGWNSGTGTSGWMQAAAGFDWRPSVAALIPSGGAVAIMLGTNDSEPAGGNFTGQQFQASLQALVTYLRGYSGLTNKPLLLVIPYQPNVTTVDPGGWAAYAAAIRAVAAANIATYVIDLNYRLPSVASGGGLYADTVHPSDLGHGLIGETVGAALKIA